jgi:4,5-dihydroxyphthalate decarboxylase
MRILIERDDLADAAAQAARASEPDTDVEIIAIRPAHRGFRAFLNESATDVSELAIVTLLQAIAYDRPIVLLPVVTLSRHQHRMLVTRQDRTVRELTGATVGVRSWSQTTGVWVRGFAAHEAHVDLHDVNWIVYEAGHLPEHQDPGWVSRAPVGSELLADFTTGLLDYAIFGNELPDDPAVHPANPGADVAARSFFTREGYVPVNHVLATTQAFAGAHAETLCGMFDAIAAALGSQGTGSVEPVGFEALRAPFTRVSEYAIEQEVLPRLVEFDEVVARSCDALRVSASRLGG